MLISELANTSSIDFNYEYLYIFPIFCYSITMIIGLLKLPSKWYYKLLRVAQFLKQINKNTEQSKFTVTGLRSKM